MSFSDDSLSLESDAYQCALRAKEELLEVVARIVLEKASHVIHYLSIGEHRLHPYSAPAKGAILDHADSSCVSGEVASDHAAALK